jgi:hypothetical protein
MARGRMISKSLSTSEKFGGLVALGELAEFAQLLYPLLVIHADDYGRLQGDAFTVKLMCLPVSPRPLETFAIALQQLDAADLITWYEVAGKRYIEIVNFDGHQSGLHKRTQSKFPDIPGNSGKFPVKRREGKGTKDNTPPTPPKRGAYLSRQELKAATERRNRVHGGCPHHPRHQTAAECIRALALEVRERG